MTKKIRIEIREDKYKIYEDCQLIDKGKNKGGIISFFKRLKDGN